MKFVWKPPESMEAAPRTKIGVATSLWNPTEAMIGDCAAQLFFMPPSTWAKAGGDMFHIRNSEARERATIVLKPKTARGRIARLVG